MYLALAWRARQSRPFAVFTKRSGVSTLCKKERMPQMRKSLVSLFAAAALLATGSGLRADTVPVNWGYTAGDVFSVFNTGSSSALGKDTSSNQFTGSSGSAYNDSGIIIY